ncbi:MAG: hypothetical protein IPN76_07255 [Saprospiraceae bacterium]|nr:hypothetical protein [Saprospiraceae bacterium]
MRILDKLTMICKTQHQIKLINHLFSFVLVMVTLNSCQQSEKTFLDFEFGMDYEAYIKHAYSLQQKGIIELKQVTGTLGGAVEGETMFYHLTLPHPKHNLNFYGEVRGNAYFKEPTNKCQA